MNEETLLAIVRKTLEKANQKIKYGLGDPEIVISNDIDMSPGKHRDGKIILFINSFNIYYLPHVPEELKTMFVEGVFLHEFCHYINQHTGASMLTSLGRKEEKEAKGCLKSKWPKHFEVSEKYLDIGYNRIGKLSV